MRGGIDWNYDILECVSQPKFEPYGNATKNTYAIPVIFFVLGSQYIM